MGTKYFLEFSLSEIKGGKMTYAKTLTQNIKVKIHPLIMKRDYDNLEPYCMFCGCRFVAGDTRHRKTWDHLDNDAENQQPWNLCYVHWICNQYKKNEYDLQFEAQQLLQQNKEWHEQNDFEFLRAREKKADTDEPTEIDLNMAHYEIAQNFLTEKITNKNPRILFSEAIYSITLRAKKQTGHGSVQSVRNYLNVLTSMEADYKVEKIEGKRYILRRNES